VLILCEYFLHQIGVRPVLVVAPQQLLAEVSALLVKPLRRFILHRDFENDPGGSVLAQAFLGAFHQVVADALPAKVRMHVERHDVADERLLLVGEDKRNHLLVHHRHADERAALGQSEGDLLGGIGNPFRKAYPVQVANGRKVGRLIISNLEGVLLYPKTAIRSLLSEDGYPMTPRMDERKTTPV